VSLSPAARRGLRTLYQALIAMITLVPALLAILPDGSPAAVKFGGIAAAVAAASGIVNKAEDAGLIPAWLKAEAPAEPPVSFN
jgi:hypothetical protein